jgi:hypothetical protein
MPKYGGMNKMDFHIYTTMRDWNRRVDPDDRFANGLDQFFGRVMNDAVSLRSAHLLAQIVNGRRAKGPAATSCGRVSSFMVFVSRATGR